MGRTLRNVGGRVPQLLAVSIAHLPVRYPVAVGKWRVTWCYPTDFVVELLRALDLDARKYSREWRSAAVLSAHERWLSERGIDGYGPAEIM